MSAKGRPERALLPLGGKARSAKGAPASAKGARATRQRGGSLIITLIAMLVLMVGAVSLLRSTDVANAIAGNAATKQAAVEAADVGLQAAAVTMSGMTNFDTNVAGRYFATQQAVDANGLLAVDWSGVATQQVGSFQVQYLIDRLCDAPLPVTDSAAQCSIAPVAGQSSSRRVGAPLYLPKPPVYFRVTARVVGPRNSESYILAVVSK
jgi:Tfp pilus assembly protein PilX